VLAGFCVRQDLAGVTSIVRALGLKESTYDNLRFTFHSTGINRQKLTEIWTRLALRLFNPVTLGGYVVFLGDGLKVGKEGKKMPGVKKLHQSSDSNTKPEFIMGHSFQAIGLLVTGMAGCLACIPIVSRIHEGVVWSNRDTRTLLDKMATMFLEIAGYINKPALLIADAYYASQKIIKPLLAAGFHLISRVKRTAVAYHPVTPPKKRGRGRPKVYGQKVKLFNLFKKKHLFMEAPSPVYGEQNVTLRYLSINLIWKPVGDLVQFVLVEHPLRGQIVLMSTDLDLCALEIIKGYGYRFKIEVSFKQALRTLGSYAYHFWMKHMEPIRRNSGDQYMHRRDEEYRDAIKRKLGAYHLYVMMGCIAQGLLQHLSMNHGELVWDTFRGWLRTMKKNLAPSELVVQNALRAALPEFLVDEQNSNDFKKFLSERVDPDRAPGLRLAG
jgi:hypothetical protein